MSEAFPGFSCHILNIESSIGKSCQILGQMTAGHGRPPMTGGMDRRQASRLNDRLPRRDPDSPPIRIDRCLVEWKDTQDPPTA